MGFYKIPWDCYFKKWWHTLLIPAFRQQGQVDLLSSRSICSTEGVPGQPGLQRGTLSWVGGEVLFGRLIGFNKTEYHHLKTLLVAFFEKNYTKVAKYCSGTKNIIKGVISYLEYHYPTCCMQNAAVTVILHLFLWSEWHFGRWVVQLEMNPALPAPELFFGS